jgi:hypothetical protein
MPYGQAAPKQPSTYALRAGYAFLECRTLYTPIHPSTHTMSATSPSSASPWHSYVEHTAALLGLKIPPEIQPGVTENFERLVAIAEPVMNFDLAVTDEPAPVFIPEGDSARP